MLQFEIKGIPVPWSAHQGYGRKAFNPKFKEREFYQWQIRSLFNRKEPIAGPIRLQVVYHMPIPKNTSGIKRRQMLNGVLHHIVRPDTSNLTKFLEDCLKTIVFADDSQVVEINAKKVYGDTPKTVVSIDSL